MTPAPQQAPKERYLSISSCNTCPNKMEMHHLFKPYGMMILPDGKESFDFQGRFVCTETEDDKEILSDLPEWCPLPCSRPHPAPAFKRCCDSCINVPCKVLNRVPCLAQEKQENICEENGCTDVENCDEICQHSRLFSPLQMQEAKDEAARQAREECAAFLKKRLRKTWEDAKEMSDDPEWEENHSFSLPYIEKEIDEALRSTQHPGQEG